MNCKILIFEVYSREALWRKNHPMHHNSSVLDKLWTDIAQVMGITNAQARKKWKHLKDSFRRELRKEINSKIENRDCPYASNWAYYNSLLFLKTEVIPNVPKHTLEELTSLSTDQGIKFEEFGDDTLQYEMITAQQQRQPIEEDFRENDDYHFFMSLIPHLQQFDSIQKLRIRNKIQQVIIDEASANANAAAKEDQDASEEMTVTLEL